jgi:hypothetical protein
MMLANDNALTNIDRRWLGWTGRHGQPVDIPWEVTYTGYVVGAIVLAVVVYLAYKLGVPFGQPALIATALITMFTTRAVIRRVDHERPVVTVVTSFWHELNAPRTPAAMRPVEWKTANIRCGKETTA